MPRPHPAPPARVASERKAVPTRFMDSERRDHFTQQLRRSVLEQNRRARDEETRRMEAYRKLCKREGIHSKRLDDYDRARQHQRETMDTQLHELETNSDMSAAAKRRRAFSIKRKAAMRATVTASLAKGQNPALKKMETVQRTREEEKQKREEQKRQADEEHAKKIENRKRIQRLYAQRTPSGQPRMQSRMECLLHKITAAVGGNAAKS